MSQFEPIPSLETPEVRPMQPHHMRLPQTPDTKLELLNRSGRPLLRILLTLGLFLYVLAVIVAAFASAWTGRAMPDMTGGFMPLALSILPLIVDQVTRSLERKAGVA